jgi:anhydro-N-acetylmuramic acid kinase
MKVKQLVIGLMSGTSADGIDAALVEIGSGKNGHTFDVKTFATYAYPRGLKALLLKNSSAKTAYLEEIGQLNVVLGRLFAKAALKLLKKAKVSAKRIACIGSHGQTILHLPRARKMFGMDAATTMQIGDPSVIAKLTGITTVGDFRIGDVAVGGSGAPLVPIFDYALLKSRRLTRGVLNIGGIANITVLPKNCSLEEVYAFDTGPGNMVVDGLMKELYGKEYDSGGKMAMRGRIIPELITELMRERYFTKRPPKSTGRELFGAAFVKRILRGGKDARKEDLIATATEFTALTIFQAYLRFIAKTDRLDELVVSGGGVHNRYLMESLKAYFEPVKVAPIDAYGISTDAKEAVCFAYLGYQTIRGVATNVPAATGAKRRAVLGKICPA